MDDILVKSMTYEKKKLKGPIKGFLCSKKLSDEAESDQVCIRHQERKIFEFSNKQQKNITQP